MRYDVYTLRVLSKSDLLRQPLDHAFQGEVDHLVVRCREEHASIVTETAGVHPLLVTRKPPYHASRAHIPQESCLVFSAGYETRVVFHNGHV